MIIHNFTAEDTRLYKEFRKLQYQCFVVKQGWDLPCDSHNLMTLKTEHDHLANYILIELDGEFIGGGRTFVYSKDFRPYKEVYKSVFENAFINENIRQVAVINGACFKTSFRKEKDGMKPEERRVRLLRRLTLEFLLSLRDKNVEIALFPL